MSTIAWDTSEVNFISRLQYRRFLWFIIVQDNLEVLAEADYILEELLCLL